MPTSEVVPDRVVPEVDISSALDIEDVVEAVVVVLVEVVLVVVTVSL